MQGEPVVKIGVDIGSVTIGVAVLKDDQLVSKSYRFHYGEIRNTFTEILKSLDFPRARLALTGRGAKIFQRALRINNVVAAVEGVKWAAQRIPRYVLGRFGYEAIVSEEMPESIVLKFRKMASPVLGTAHPLLEPYIYYLKKRKERRLSQAKRRD